MEIKHDLSIWLYLKDNLMPLVCKHDLRHMTGSNEAQSGSVHGMWWCVVCGAILLNPELCHMNITQLGNEKVSNGDPVARKTQRNDREKYHRSNKTDCCNRRNQAQLSAIKQCISLSRQKPQKTSEARIVPLRAIIHDTIAYGTSLRVLFEKKVYHREENVAKETLTYRKETIRTPMDSLGKKVKVQKYTEHVTEWESPSRWE